MITKGPVAALELFYDEFVAKLEAMPVHDAEDEWAQGFNDAVANIIKMLGEQMMEYRK